MQYIHLGILQVRIQTLHRQEEGTMALIGFRDNRWIGDQSILATMEVDLARGSQLVYVISDIMLTIGDFFRNIQVSILTKGYEQWRDGEANLLITRQLVGRLSNTPNVGFAYEVQGVVDYLTSHGSRSLFVKNLNFKTTDESLRNHFSDKMKNGTLRSVKVKKHVLGGKTVSMGLGSIEFDSLETATNVCKDLQGTVLDGHALILELCHSKTAGETPKKDEKNKSLTTLIVKNVAFEATEKDLKQLFGPFGQIKSLRLPVKFGGHHKGYAFVEFVTKQDQAQNAMENLSNTHLYGRHLVLERAKDKETMEDLRAKAAARFADGQNIVSKKRKQDTLAEKAEKITRYLLSFVS